MDPLSLLLRIASSWSDWSKNDSLAFDEAKYLSNEYNLPPLRYGKSKGRYGVWMEADTAWRQLSVDFVTRIVNAYALSDLIHKSCADLAIMVHMFEYRGIYPYNEKGEQYSVDLALESLQNTSTLKSLVELGRGFGGEYALKQLQNELRSKFAFVFA